MWELYQRFFKAGIGGVLILSLLSCSVHSVESYRRKGAREAESFANELSTIHNSQELLRAEPMMRKHFLALVHLMIEARKWQKEHDIPLPDVRPCVAYEHLQEQLARIAFMEGGREVIRRAQQEALICLDRQERRIQKRERAQLDKPFEK